ncbi:FxsA family protein [Thioclava atlantica]|uniref:FxsA cytoplasmic membrane protein n=1 Tax=Thioclava atlantica TaxID=1317124 RepID=A0A085TWZ2_9RHOB|nr:FxsA family protein [Thioclava atlantica]KFE35239.1 FxsA cytoplasmic membrane protein [Thioclava atlantica]
MWIFLAFLAVPLIEIGLFIKVGGLIGLWPTLGIVLLTAIVGTALVQREGARALDDLRGSLNELRDPSRPLAHGAMILVAGVLLLTPGFFTDTVGLLLLIPGTRDWIMKTLGRHVKVSRFEMGGAYRTGPHDGRRSNDPEILDAEEAEQMTHRHPPSDGPSGWTRH